MAVKNGNGKKQLVSGGFPYMSDILDLPMLRRHSVLGRLPGSCGLVTSVGAIHQPGTSLSVHFQVSNESIHSLSICSMNVSMVFGDL